MYTYVYFSLPIWVNTFSQTPRGDPVSTKGQAAASGAFVQLGGCLCKQNA